MKLTCASPCELLAARDGSAALPDLGVDGWELPVRRKLLPARPGLRDGCAGHMAAFEWLLLPVLVTLSPAEASRPSLVPLCKGPIFALLTVNVYLLQTRAHRE